LFRGVNTCVDGTIARNKFSGQLFYLSEELLPLAFFDQEVMDDMKRRMVAALDKDMKIPQKCPEERLVILLLG